MRSLIAIFTILALAACAGGGSTPLPDSPISSPIASRHKHGSLKIGIHIPKKRRHVRIKVMRHGKPAYISPATQSMSIDITGPTNVNEAVGLTPSSTGCSSSLTGTFCTLTLSGLAPGNYTASISTYDGPVSASGTATGTVLSQTQSVGFTIVAGQSNTVNMTLGGIPASVVLVPNASSTLVGNMNTGYTLSKCGSDTVSVIGVDADDNYILGAGAPTPSLSSDSATLTVASPAPNSPNAFIITRPTGDIPPGGSTVHLTASVTPSTGSGGSTVTSSPIAMTFDGRICGVITQFPIPSAGAAPLGITKGPDGAMWFTEDGTGKLGRITTNGTVTETPLSSAYGGSIQPYPDGIATGSDGALWYTDRTEVVIGRVTTTGSVSIYPTSLNGPVGITNGPDGRLWFTSTNGLGAITTSGTITEYTSGASFGTNITVGSDGALWFTQCQGTKVGRSTTTGTITEYTLPSGATYPNFIASGPDGALWFTNASNIATITTAGSITELTSVSAGANSPIMNGPDGALWFANCNTRQLERLTTNGVLTEEYALPGSNPYELTGIALGPDRAIWILDASDNAIDRVQ